MTPTRDPLQAVKRAAVSRRRAELRFRAALVDAHAGGVTHAELARTLGTSRQAVRQLLKRIPSDERAGHPVASVVCEHGKIGGIGCRSCELKRMPSR